MPTGRGGTGAALAAPAMGCGRRGLRGALGLWCGVQAAVRNGSRPESQAGLQGGLRPRGEACTDTHTPSMPPTHSCSHTRTRSGSCAHLCTLTHTDTHIYAPHARTQPPHTPGEGPSDTLSRLRMQPPAPGSRGGGGLSEGPWGCPPQPGVTRRGGHRAPSWEGSGRATEPALPSSASAEASRLSWYPQSCVKEGGLTSIPGLGGGTWGAHSAPGAPGPLLVWL